MDAEQQVVAAVDPWALALPVLAGQHHEAVADLAAGVAAVRGAGARLFEVIVGTPVAAYGARLTFRTGDGDVAAIEDVTGLSGHPWGTPDWIGLRTAADGSVRAKAYHRRPPLDATLVHRGLPDTARPVMAARDGQTIEVYAALPGSMSWARFADNALVPLGCEPVPPGVSVLPRAHSFGVSVRHDADALTAITLFVSSDALRPDADLEQEWVAGLSPEDAGQHQSRVAAAATVSRTVGRRYRMVSWTYDSSGLVTRAVSLHSGDALDDR